jgi:hypothetical protein
VKLVQHGHGDGGPKLFCDLLSRALTGACDPELFLQFVDLAEAKGALAMATQIVMITTTIADTISTQRMRAASCKRRNASKG